MLIGTSTAGQPCDAALSFVESIVNHREGKPWPGHAVGRLRLRETDRDIQRHTELWPLSVSSTLIGVVAMRCALLLSLYEERHGHASRDGSGRLVEVYPAAALKRWDFTYQGYKGKKGQKVRCELLDTIRKRTRDWLTLPDSVCQSCQDSDDVLDAVVAALVARAAATGNKRDGRVGSRCQRPIAWMRWQ